EPVNDDVGAVPAEFVCQRLADTRRGIGGHTAHALELSLSIHFGSFSGDVAAWSPGWAACPAQNGVSTSVWYHPRMVESDRVRERELTPKGRATRDRIVAAAADLMSEQGVAETSLQDVQQAARVS